MMLKLGIVFVFFSSGLLAQVNFDPIIVSSKLKQNSIDMVNSHASLEKEVVKNTTNLRASDLLQNISGVSINQTGAVSGQSSVYIRGSENRHTVIMIDGVKVYDPASLDRTINLATLNTFDIERVEVLKGSQSVLYGSDAIGGVINLITKKGSTKQKISIGAGLTNSVATSSTLLLDSGLIRLGTHYQHFEALSQARGGEEEDLSVNKGVTVNSNLEFGKIELATLIKINDTFTETDTFDFTLDIPVDAEGDFAAEAQQVFEQGVSFKLNNTQSLLLDLSYIKIDRRNKTSVSDNYFTGTARSVDFRLLEKLDFISYTIGVNHLLETYLNSSTSEKSVNSFDVYGSSTVNIANFIFDIGARRTENHNFGNEIVYNLGTETKIARGHSIFFNHSTGFKSPSIYQLKAPALVYPGPTIVLIGNEDLTPERSKNYEVGYQLQKENVKLEVALFYKEVDDYIDYSATKGYINLHKNIYKGLDLSAQTKAVGGNLSLINYSLSNGTEVERRPSISSNLFYNCKFSDTLNIRADWKYQGRRFEYIGSDKEELKAFDTTDITIRKQWRSLTGKLGVINIFDHGYELAKGYSVVRRGVQASLDFRY